MKYENDIDKNMHEICGNCGLSFGSHCGGDYQSDFYNMFIPKSYCPGNEGRMNWDEGPGTVFKHTGIYEEVVPNKRAENRED